MPTRWTPGTKTGAMLTQKRLSTDRGDGRLEVAGDSYLVQYVIHVYQNFVDGIPGQQHAGGTLDFPELGTVAARHSDQEIVLELTNGTRARINLIDAYGHFKTREKFK